jgi:prolyl-tRNA editing enzyme YbaK/EbsC (Cys-tRNA(Pro) deacylase)
MTVGGVTAFGLPPGLPLYVDARVLDLDWVILGTGGRNGKIRISPEVFRRVPGAKVVEGLAVPQPGTVR